MGVAEGIVNLSQKDFPPPKRLLTEEEEIDLESSSQGLRDVGAEDDYALFLSQASSITLPSG